MPPCCDDDGRAPDGVGDRLVGGGPEREPEFTDIRKRSRFDIGLVILRKPTGISSLVSSRWTDDTVALVDHGMAVVVSTLLRRRQPGAPSLAARRRLSG